MQQKIITNLYEFFDVCQDIQEYWRIFRKFHKHIVYYVFQFRMKLVDEDLYQLLGLNKESCLKLFKIKYP